MQAREVVSFFQRGVINQAINGVEGRKVTSGGTPDEGISMYSSFIAMVAIGMSKTQFSSSMAIGM